MLKWLRRVAPATIAVILVVLALAGGHADRSSVSATDEGSGPAVAQVQMGDVSMTCQLEVTLQGDGSVGNEPEVYDYTSEFTATSECVLDGEVEPTIFAEISGSYEGVITEQDPNENDVLDGFADGRFDVSIVADSEQLGTLETELPFVLVCLDMDLRTRPASYSCNLDPELGPVELFGLDEEVMMLSLDLTIEEPGFGDAVTPAPPTEGPNAGFGPDDSSSGSDSINGFVIALAAVGGLLIAGAGALVLSRRE